MPGRARLQGASRAVRRMRMEVSLPKGSVKIVGGQPERNTQDRRSIQTFLLTQTQCHSPKVKYPFHEPTGTVQDRQIAKERPGNFRFSDSGFR